MPWLDDYMLYVHEAEVPENYAFWSGIVAIASVLKRNVFYRRKLQVIYPNVYIILCGPPSAGKGSTMAPTIEIIRETGIANILSDRMSAEEIVSLISDGFGQGLHTQGNIVSVGKQDHSVCFIETELGALFGISDWMLEFLCKMWDEGSFEYRTKSNHSKIVAIKDSAACLYGATVSEFLKKITKNQQTSAISGGFASRCIMPYSTTRKSADFWGEIPQKKIISKSDLVNELRDIHQKCQGEFIFTKKAKELMADFYYDIDFDADCSEVIKNFLGRMTTHVGKTAMCIAASEHSYNTILERHVQIAIDEIKKIKNSLDITFAFVGESPDVEAIARVQQFVDKKGLCSRREMLYSLKRNVSADQLDRILLVLEASGEIEYFTDPSSKKILIKSIV